MFTDGKVTNLFLFDTIYAIFILKLKYRIVMISFSSQYINIVYIKYTFRLTK